MVNRVTLIGNLTRDAESIAARSPMTRMRLATNSVWRDANGNRQEQAEYHTVISFGRLAEICAAYCVKGRRIFVEGKLRYREYDASDGQRKVATEIVADVVRHALLCVLIVLAPLAALCTVLPDTRGHARGWLRLFGVTVLMQPVQLIVLRVAEVAAVDEGGGLVQSLYALATLFLMLKVPGALNVAAHLETKAETLGHRLERSIRRATIHHGHPTRRGG